MASFDQGGGSAGPHLARFDLRQHRELLQALQVAGDPLDAFLAVRSASGLKVWILPPFVAVRVPVR